MKQYKILIKYNSNLKDSYTFVHAATDAKALKIARAIYGTLNSYSILEKTKIKKIRGGGVGMLGSFVKMKNGTETMTFFLFDDGTARKLTGNGWDKNIIDDFLKEYKNLKNAGYTEI